MSQKLLAIQNRKIALLNRLQEITAQKQIIDFMLERTEGIKIPIFDICFEEK